MDPSEIVRHGYDKIAGDYLNVREKNSTDVLLLEELISVLPDGSDVLDAGCGAGIPIARILSESFQVVGVDFSSSQLALARKNVPTASFELQDLTKLDFPNDHFDGVVSYYAIIHIPRRYHRGIIQRFFELLKPGGYLLLCTGAGDLKDDIADDYLGVRMYWSHFGAKTNQLMVKDCGFRIIWAREIEDETCAGGKHLFILAQK